VKPTERDLMVARAVVGRRIANETDLVALLESLPEPAWPDWLSSEYQAIKKMIVVAMDRAEEDIRNSEDASGLSRTHDGERNLYAGAIMHSLKRAGWVPPLGTPEPEIAPVETAASAEHAESKPLPTIDEIYGILGAGTPQPAEHEQAAQDAVIDCGDNSCIFKPSGAGGMRTNGGCRCYERAGFGASAVEAARKMLPEVLRLRREVSVAKREERERVTAIFLDEMQQAHEEQAAHPHAKCINLLEEQHLVNESLRAEIAAARAEAARAERERWMQTVDDNTGPTGGWLCSPKKLEQAATRAAQDEPGGKGD